MLDNKNVPHAHFTSIGKNVGYNDRIREYYIVIEDHGDVYESQSISFCPICGEKLPDSLFDDWADRLDKLGIDPLNDPIPAEYSDGTWWREQY